MNHVTTQRAIGDILLVSSDSQQREAIANSLTIAGHDVIAVGSHAAGRTQIRAALPDLAVLLTPSIAAEDFAFIERVRAGRVSNAVRAANMPITIVSGPCSEEQRIRAFELGCDDVIVTPFSAGELNGRVSALMRRSSNGPTSQTTRCGEITIDKAKRAVTVAGRLVSLTVKEYALLNALAEDPHRVYTREELLRIVWGYRTAGSTRTLDAHACRLRAKLCANTGERYVQNLWGVGYRLLEPVAELGDVA